MHTQTGTTTTTTTTTMAYNSVPLPASPTLTNPDMILPWSEYDDTADTSTLQYRTGSMGEDWDNGNMQFSIGPPHSRMGLMTPTTPIIYGNGTMLSDIGEVTEAESTKGRKLPGPAERRLLKQQQSHHSFPKTSPTMPYDSVMKRAKTGTHQRSVSVESTSTVTSAGFTAELFKDFDDGVSVDDSVFQGDDEESVADSYVADSYTEEVIASETQRLEKKASTIGQEEDISSQALSRRAEQILLSAKKRLTNMEGNLTRARSSLYINPTASALSSSPLNRVSPDPPTASDQRRIVTAVGAATFGRSPITSPGHARVSSDNSFSSPARTPPFRVPIPVRARSAADRYGERKVSPKLEQHQESPREDSRPTSRSGYSSVSNRISPQHAIVLEPLDEDNASPDFEADRASMRSSTDGYLTPAIGEHRGLQRSASSSQMRDLKDQMQDLKGRLSVLRDRARDDTMKRRSLQSLRTPSPFTAAEEWYAGAKNYGDPLSAEAGIAQAPWKEEGEEREGGETPTHDKQILAAPVLMYPESDVTSIYEDVAESHNATDDTESQLEPNLEDGGMEENYEVAEEDTAELLEENYLNDYTEEIIDADEAENYETDDSSLYHDTLTTPLSHEDREDAFDYEHFFLHSAMGTISQQRNERRGSFSSEDSVETVHGPSVPAPQPERTSFSHFRSESTDSVSTIASFATATEGNGSEAGEVNNEYQDFDFAVQDVGNRRAHATKRSTFGTAALLKGFVAETRRATTGSAFRPRSMSHDPEQRNSNGHNAGRPSVSSIDSFESVGTTRSFPLVNKPKSTPSTSSTPDFRRQSNEFEFTGDSTTLTEGKEDSPINMLANEDQVLVERLVASLGQCVLGLQEAGHGSYESRTWRRRLDAARRVLEGQEGAI